MKRAAHILLSAYFAGRNAPDRWFTTPVALIRPIHAPAPLSNDALGGPGAEEEAAKAHKKMMEHPMFPRQPWFWDPPSDVAGHGEGEDGGGRGRVLNWRKLRELVPQMVCAPPPPSATSLLVPLLARRVPCRVPRSVVPIL